MKEKQAGAWRHGRGKESGKERRTGGKRNGGKGFSPPQYVNRSNATDNSLVQDHSEPHTASTSTKYNHLTTNANNVSVSLWQKDVCEVNMHYQLCLPFLTTKLAQWWLCRHSCRSQKRHQRHICSFDDVIDNTLLQLSMQQLILLYDLQQSPFQLLHVCLQPPQTYWPLNPQTCTTITDCRTFTGQTRTTITDLLTTRHSLVKHVRPSRTYWPPDIYWSNIYDHHGLTHRRMFTCQTYADCGQGISLSASYSTITLSNLFFLYTCQSKWYYIASLLVLCSTTNDQSQPNKCLHYTDKWVYWTYSELVIVCMQMLQLVSLSLHHFWQFISS